MANKLRIYRGLPGSGKSTLAKEWVERNPDWRIRINRDDLRLATYGRYDLHFESDGEDKKKFGAREGVITAIFNATLDAAVKMRKDIAVDNLNLAASYVKDLLKVAAKAGYEVEFVDVDVDVEEVIRRDSLRDRKVGEKAIRGIYKRYFFKGKFPAVPVLSEEGASGRIPYKTPEGNKPKAVILDMDGTAALIGDHEGHRGPFMWSRVGEDAVNPHVYEIIKLLTDQDYTILVTSGRDEVCRQETADWLDKNDFKYDKLFMRKLGDQRKDDVIKYEIFDEKIRDNYDIRFVFDDRLRVCRLWHELELPLFRLGDPDSDF